MRDADGGGGKHHPSFFSSNLHFFEVMLMTGIDEIRGCLEDYIFSTSFF